MSRNSRCSHIYLLKINYANILLKATVIKQHKPVVVILHKSAEAFLKPYFIMLQLS